MIPRDISVTVLCGSEDDHTPVSSDQVLSDVDLLARSGHRLLLLNVLRFRGRMAL